jgi:tetratricopeptide (TPR) repeat protein
MRRIVLDQARLGELQPSQDLALIIGALSALSALLFHSFLDFNMHIPANALLAALLFGLLARPASDASATGSGSVWGSRLWRVVIAALALVLMGVSVRFLPGEFYAEKARVALRDDHNADAEEFARRGIAWEKENPALYGYLGEAKHFLTLTAPDPASARILHEDAVAAYQSGLKLFPQDTGLLLKEAQALDLLERYPEAEEVFQKLLKVDPMFRNVYAYYGLHWQLQRRIATAERCFRIAAQLGEPQIAPKALANIERMKNDPVSSSLVTRLPDVDIDLPAERLLPKP